MLRWLIVIFLLAQHTSVAVNTLWWLSNTVNSMTGLGISWMGDHCQMDKQKPSWYVTQVNSARPSLYS